MYTHTYSNSHDSDDDDDDDDDAADDTTLWKQNTGFLLVSSDRLEIVFAGCMRAVTTHVMCSISLPCNDIYKYPFSSRLSIFKHLFGLCFSV